MCTFPVEFLFTSETHEEEASAVEDRDRTAESKPECCVQIAEATVAIPATDDLDTASVDPKRLLKLDQSYRSSLRLHTAGRTDHHLVSVQDGSHECFC